MAVLEFTAKAASDFAVNSSTMFGSFHFSQSQSVGTVNIQIKKAMDIANSTTCCMRLLTTRYPRDTTQEHIVSQGNAVNSKNPLTDLTLFSIPNRWPTQNEVYAHASDMSMTERQIVLPRNENPRWKAIISSLLPRPT